MTKFWIADPDHFAGWGERGSLPEEPRTIHKTYSADGRSLIDTDRDTVLKDGLFNNIPINATEAQKAREIRDGMTPEHQ